LPSDDLSRKFIRAAGQRFIAVELLLREGLNFEAVYLAGYVIECSMKAVVLRNTLARNRKHFAGAYFKGRQGHNFEVLKKMLVDRGSRLPSSLSQELHRTAWSTDLRYEVGRFDAAEVIAFISTARRVLEWARKMS
jgi:HEPN domain-containing protein